MSFTTHVQNDLVWLTSSLLGGSPHGFSTRKGGVSPAPWDSLNLRSGCGDSQDHVLENFHRLCWAVGIPADRLVLSKQVHETTVRPCTFSDAGKGLWLKQDYTADALITNEPGLPLTVFSADCGVILLHDPIQGAVGAVHAGWRGCAGGILEKTVEELHRLYGSHPSHLRAALGPCIGQCCFETDDDVPEAMLASLGQDAAACLKRQGPKWHVDLAGLNRQWLLRAGLQPEHIDVSGLCTACHPDLFWSHRKMGEKRGVQAAIISLPTRGAT